MAASLSANRQELLCKSVHEVSFLKVLILDSGRRGLFRGEFFCSPCRLGSGCPASPKCPAGESQKRAAYGVGCVKGGASGSLDSRY